jgi:hypothetical protein
MHAAQGHLVLKDRRHHGFNFMNPRLKKANRRKNNRK